MHSMRLTKRFDDALLWATNLHAGQVRKKTDKDEGGIPYISHLLAVAAIVIENSSDEDVAIAALLHDAAEDQGGQEILDKIERQFGSKVSDIVLACSDTLHKKKPAYRKRKEAYLRHLRESTSQSAQLVSLADKIHNARSILNDYKAVGEELWERFNGGKEGTLWYYRELVDAFKGLNCPDHAILVEELKRLVDETERLVSLNNIHGRR